MTLNSVIDRRRAISLRQLSFLFTFSSIGWILGSPKAWDIPPQTPLGEPTALPQPLAGFRGLTSKGRGVEVKEGEREGRGRGGKGRKWEGQRKEGRGAKGKRACINFS